LGSTTALWREAGPPNHHDDKVDSDQQVVKKELSLCPLRPAGSLPGGCLEFGGLDVKIRVKGLRVRVWGLGSREQGFGFRETVKEGLECMVSS